MSSVTPDWPVPSSLSTFQLAWVTLVSCNEPVEELRSTKEGAEVPLTSK